MSQLASGADDLKTQVREEVDAEMVGVAWRCC